MNNSNNSYNSRYMQSCIAVGDRNIPEVGKWPHGHHLFYDFLRENFDPTTVAEFGILHGNQHFIWEDFWSQSVIIGVEREDPEQFPEYYHSLSAAQLNREGYQKIKQFAERSNRFSMHYQFDIWNTRTREMLQDTYGKVDLIINGAMENEYSWWEMQRLYEDVIGDNGVIVNEAQGCSNRDYNTFRFCEQSMKMSKDEGWLVFDFWQHGKHSPTGIRVNNSSGLGPGCNNMRAVMGIFTKNQPLKQQLQDQFAEYTVENFEHLKNNPLRPCKESPGRGNSHHVKTRQAQLKRAIDKYYYTQGNNQ